MTICALFIATFVLGVTGIPVNLNSRVLGGENALIADYPWQVSIEVIGYFNCSGVIVKDNYVATTASCVNYTKDDLSVRAGTSLRGKDGVVHDVDKVVPHEKWTLNSSAYDIAVLRVKDPFVFSDECKAAELYEANDTSPAPGTEGELIGWGQVVNSAQIQMQHATLKVLERTDCENLLDGQICVHGDGKSACSGDKGGPFIVGRRIAGLASTGFDCDVTKDNLIVLTDIVSYRDWIDEHANY